MEIRRIENSITFANDIDSLLSIIMVYDGTKELTIGDISKFTKQMKKELYRFIEQHPEVNLYSSIDINDEKLLSRSFLYLKNDKNAYVKPTFEREMTFEDAYQLNISNDMKLRCVNTKKFVRDLCQSL